MKSNRTGIAKELQFLEDWGRIFREAAQQHPTRLHLAQLYKTCVDAYLRLEGKEPHFNVGIQDGLKQFQQYIQTLATEGAFNPDIAGRRIKYIGSIAEMLSEKPIVVQASLFPTVGKVLRN